MDESNLRALLERYHAGDAEAAKEIAAEMQPHFIPALARALRGWAPVEDVAQSIVLSYLQNHVGALDRITEADELRSLFTALARRHCDKHRRRGERRPRALSIDGLLFLLADDEPPPDVKAALADEALATIKQCEHHLASQSKDPATIKRRQQVLAMLLTGMKRREIAHQLEISLPTVDRDLSKIEEVFFKLADAAAT
jgi:DNA-directed RNA polymerase specialized sigma24 family protein